MQQAKPQAFGFPELGDAAGEGEGLGPGEQLRGELDELEPDRVLGELVQREVAQPAVFEAVNPVFGAGAHPVPQLEVGDPPAAGVGREHRDPPTFDIGQP